MGRWDMPKLSAYVSPNRPFPIFVSNIAIYSVRMGTDPISLEIEDRNIATLVGVPGGTSSTYATQLVEASKMNRDKLDFAKGRGNDPDRRALAFIMDTADFPFFVAEQYHQFHDGFNLGENYPPSYNNLAGKLAKEGTLGISDCPDGLLGVGVLGL
jgi:hypothetical protein